MKARVVLAGLLLLAAATVARAAQPAGGHRRGEQAYRTFCWTCHGRYGRGDGPAAEYLAVKPPDLTDPKVLAGKSDGEIIARLKNPKLKGGTAHMPMVVIAQSIREDVLRDAIDYMRTLALPGKHVSLLAGEDIYRTFCQACHGERGDGQGPAAKNLPGVKPRDFTADDFVIEGHEKEIYRAIFMGAAKAFHGSPYMPEWRTTLSPQQIEDVMAYLQSLKEKARRHRR